MKRLVLAALVAQLGACEKPSEDLPLNPGGGGGTGSQFTPDAAMIETDASPLITGRVCFLLTNFNTPGTCAPEAGEFTVRLGSAMVQTALDGSFTLMRPTSTSGLTWLVSRGDAITSAIKYGATTTLPALEAQAYFDMVATNNVTRVDGNGAMMVRVRRAGVAVTGATVSTQPAPDPAAIYYDGQNDSVWETDTTHTFGVAWIPSLPVGSAQVTVTSNQVATVIAANPVFGDAITFVFAEIP
jgi:hypothetical protein